MFKTGIFTQRISVCLRCQYRLAWRQKLRLRSKATYLQKHQQHRRFTLGRYLHQQEASASLGPDDDIISKSIITYEPSNGAYKRNPQGRNNFTSSKSDLGFDALGKPAEILIIREREKSDHDTPRRSPISSSTHEPRHETISPREILAEIDAERGIVDIVQACENIDDVKTIFQTDPKLPWESVGSIVSTQEYEEATTKLRKGFTVAQLAAYFRKNVDRRPVGPLDLHHSFSSTLYARSSWEPGTTDLWQIRAPGLKNVRKEVGGFRGSYKLKKQKSAVISDIMTHCWRVRPADEASSQGEMDIRLQPAHMALIVNHSTQIDVTHLDCINADY